MDPEERKSNIQETPPSYHVSQPISAPSDVKKNDSAEYPPQVSGYPTGLRPTQNFPLQEYYPAPQQGYPLQPYPQNNMVVVGQPVPAPVMTTAGADSTTLTVQPAHNRKAKDFLLFTMVLMLLCFLHGNILNTLLTLPALICSLVARDYNRSGNYTGAKQCGYMALGCNIAAIVYYAIEIITVVIVFAVVFSENSSSTSGSCVCRPYTYSSYDGHCKSYYC